MRPNVVRKGERQKKRVRIEKTRPNAAQKEERHKGGRRIETPTRPNATRK